MKKKISISVIVIGAILFIVGLFTQIPSKELTTYELLDDKYSVIEEYVGGDAYNYIIGASLVGGEIAGAKTQKAVFISVGLLIICLGLCLLAFSKEDTNEVTLRETAENEIISDTEVNETDVVLENEETTEDDIVSEETTNNE